MEFGVIKLLVFLEIFCRLSGMKPIPLGLYTPLAIV